MGPRRKVIVDFDGTACLPDTGHLVASRFGGPEWDRLEKLWVSGRIGTRERATGQFGSADISEASLRELLGQAVLDPTFAEFRRFAREHRAEVEIVSDGFDFIIQHVLDRDGADDIRFYANTMKFVNGRLELGFPREGEGCGRCGLCKAAPMRAARERFDEVAFIGNGFSDACAAPLADVLFAKESLAKRCIELGIPFHRFHDFRDVIGVLRDRWSSAALVPRVT